MKRTAIFGVVVIAAACGRSGLELADALDDSEGSGGRSGSPPTGDDDVGGGAVTAGGVGNTTPGGSGGRPMPPLDPGGLIPNCRADSPVTVVPKDRHWLYLEGRPSAQAEEGGYVVELTPDGPRNVTYLSEAGGFWDWSPDGRFLLVTGAERPHPFELFDFSQGAPVRVDVPSLHGFLKWSHAHARYALDPDPTTALPSQLVIVDATTATEQAIDLPELHIGLESWSPDDRYVALAGSGGLVLVDTSGPALELSTVYDRHASDVLWSDDGRYLAFQSLLSGGNDWMLYVFDTQSGQLKIAEAVWLPRLFYGWAGNTSLIVEELGGLSVYIDVTRRSLDPVLLVQHGTGRPNGAISPGHKCYIYEGFCEAAREDGICVKALPPDPQAPAVLIQRFDGNAWSKNWAGTGDQLLLHSDAEPWLVNVALDGGEFTRRFVTDGTFTTDVDTVLGWNPSGRTDWIAYFASPSPGNERNEHPRLWHRETRASYDVPMGEDDASRWAWSSDGRYLVVQGEPTSGDGAYYVQEVFEGGLGRSWRIDELVPSESGDSLWPYYVQP